MATKGIIDRDLGLKRIIKQLKKIKGSSVTIGLHNDTGKYPVSSGTPVRDVGFFLEFGTIKMPARPWLRSAFDKRTKKLAAAVRRGVNAIYSGVSTSKNLLDGIGREFLDDVKSDIAADKIRPKTGPVQLAKKIRKGRPEITLIETFRLHDSIRHKVKI